MRRTSVCWAAVTAVALIISVTEGYADSGAAYLRSTDESRAPLGEVAFEDTAEGLRIEAKVSGAAPGLHGFHIHQFGNCGEEGNAAGPHYNPGVCRTEIWPHRG